MSRGGWIALGALVLVLVVGGGTAVVVIRSRGDFLRVMADGVRRYLEGAFPSLTPTQRGTAARIVAAQGALESGYGDTPQFKLGWNFGNVSKGSWAGPTIGGGDSFYDDATGKRTPIRQEWRKYASLDAAIADFFALLSWSRYVAARSALFAGDANLFAAELRRGGYFTAPLAEYQAGVQAALAAAGKVA